MSYQEQLDMLWHYYDGLKAPQGEIIQWTRELIKEMEQKSGNASLIKSAKQLLSNMGDCQ